MKLALALLGLLAVLKLERDIRKNAFVQYRLMAFNVDKHENFESAYYTEIGAIRRMYR